MKKLSAIICIAIAPCLAQAEDTDYALLTGGASFVSASSYIYGPNTAMENNLLRDSKTAWFSNGDSSFMFGNNDLTQSITINLGSSRNIDSVGAMVELVDRPVDPAKFHAKVSVNGYVWQDWTGVMTNFDGLLTITGASQNVQFVQYIFGAPNWIHYPNNGQSRITQLYAAGAILDGTIPTGNIPEPENYAMMLMGLTVMGFVARRRNSA